MIVEIYPFCYFLYLLVQSIYWRPSFHDHCQSKYLLLCYTCYENLYKEWTAKVSVAAAWLDIIALHNYMTSLEIFKQCANIRKKRKKRTINLIFKKYYKAVLLYKNLML